MSKIQVIKDKINLQHFVNSQLNMNVEVGQRCVASYRNGSNPTSFQLFEDTYCDWGFPGEPRVHCDVIQLCADAMFNSDIGKAIEYLGRDIFVNDKLSSISYISRRNSIERLVKACYANLRPQDKEYLNSRAITNETIDRLKIGYNKNSDRLIIPYWHCGHVVYYAGRDCSGQWKNDKSVPKYSKMKIKYDYDQNTIWGLHTLEPEHRAKFSAGTTDSKGNVINFADVLCVAEGAVDALSFEQEGYQVLSPIGGYFNQIETKRFLSIAKAVGHVFICFDNDGAGTGFQKKMARMLLSRRIHFVCGTVPQEFNGQKIKDVSDYYTAGGNIADLISQAQDGTMYLAKSFSENDLETFKEFLRELARYSDKSYVRSFCNKCEGISRDVRDLCMKEAVKPITACEIVNELVGNADRRKFNEKLVQGKYILRYLHEDGFYLYNNGVYTKMHDLQIQRLISEEFGSHTNYDQISDAFKLLRVVCETGQNFNTAHVWNFPNGILDLSNVDNLANDKKLLEHSPLYLSSVQMKYNFDKNAKCEGWEAFLQDVFDGDIERIRLLQEYFGYCFYNDCRYQVGLFMKGDGANGKSVVVEVMRALFGNKNCSDVRLNKLGEPFECIHTRYSIVNFSSETSTNIKIAQEAFKNLTEGRTISGSFKFRDMIYFEPRCKLVACVNNNFTVFDFTRAIYRRMIILPFNNNYTGREDVRLTEKLTKELPGIFNWALEGYLRLMKNGSFSECTAAKEEMLKFQSESNPLFDFVNQELLDQFGYQVSTTEMYKNYYLPWCEGQCIEKPLSQVLFNRQLKPILRQKRPDMIIPETGDIVIHTRRADYYVFPGASTSTVEKQTEQLNFGFTKPEELGQKATGNVGTQQQDENQSPKSEQLDLNFETPGTPKDDKAHDKKTAPDDNEKNEKNINPSESQTKPTKEDTSINGVDDGEKNNLADNMQPRNIGDILDGNFKRRMDELNESGYNYTEDLEIDEYDSKIDSEECGALNISDIKYLVQASVLNPNDDDIYEFCNTDIQEPEQDSDLLEREEEDDDEEDDDDTLDVEVYDTLGLGIPVPDLDATDPHNVNFDKERLPLDLITPDQTGFKSLYKILKENSIDYYDKYKIRLSYADRTHLFIPSFYNPQCLAEIKADTVHKNYAPTLKLIRRACTWITTLMRIPEVCLAGSQIIKEYEFWRRRILHSKNIMTAVVKVFVEYQGMQPPVLKLYNAQERSYYNYRWEYLNARGIDKKQAIIDLLAGDDRDNDDEKEQKARQYYTYLYQNMKNDKIGCKNYMLDYLACCVWHLCFYNGKSWEFSDSGNKHFNSMFLIS